MRNRSTLALATPLVLAASLVLTGCQRSEPTPEAAPAQVVESQAAAIRIAALPSSFEVASNGSDALTLAVPSEVAPGTMTVTMSNEYPDGLNIIEAIEVEMANFEAKPEGRSFGQTKMVAPIGLTYMARGRYQENGAELEELRAMLAHPWGNRLLTLSYVYPAGDDSSERGAQLMELLGEMEALPAPQEAPEEAPE